MAKQIINLQNDIVIEAAGLRIPRAIMNPAYSGGKLLLPHFELPVVIDLESCTVTNNMPILYAHDQLRRVGHTHEVINDGKTITIKGVLSSLNSDVREIVRTSGLGARWQVSVGTGIIEAINQDLLPENKTITINGQTITGPAIIVINTEIKEVSFVPVGGDAHTEVIIKASGLNNNNSRIGVTKMNFDQWLKDHGFDPATIKAETLEALKLAFEAEFGGEEPVQGGGTEEPKDPPKEEDKPVQAGGTEEPKDPPKEEEKKPVQATGIPGVTLRPAGHPHNYVNSNPNPNRVIEASMLASASGLSGKRIEAMGYTQTELDMASGRQYRSIGLHDLFRMAFGNSYSGSMHTQEFAGYAIHASGEIHRKVMASGMGASGFSSINVPGILSNVANKTLQEAYLTFTQNAIGMKISGSGSAKDFKPVSTFQFDMTGELVELKPGGVFEHATFVETGRTNKISTRGLMVTLTRADIINDDLGAFTRIPKQLGDKAAKSLEKAILGVLLKRSDEIFSNANKNLVTGNPFSIQSLSNVNQVFMEQVGIGGEDDFILISPQILLVPPALWANAKAVYTSTIVNETTATGKPSPVNNIWANTFEPITSPFLGAAANIGGTNTNYWLFADPAIAPVIETLFLNNVQSPVIESSDADFNTHGISWRCYFDFGVGIGDPRGAVKCTGI
jgi:hypothetical protein